MSTGAGPDALDGDPVPGADDDGSLERHGALAVLRYRSRLAHPRDKVWRALTEDDHLAGWFPTTIEGERSAGAPLSFSFREYAKAARDAAGLHVCLEQLDFVCAGDSPPWQPPERWRVVPARYVAAFGPEATAVGPPQEWERVHGGDGEGAPLHRPVG